MKAGVVEPPVEDGSPSSAVSSSRMLSCVAQFGDRVGAGGGQQQQMAAQRRPGWLLVSPLINWSASWFEAADHLRSGEVFGGEWRASR